MATLGSTNITAGVLGSPVPLGGLHLEVWRVPGGTVGDTATITPLHGGKVVAATCGHAATTSIGTGGADTNVVFTLTASVATSVNFDVWLLCAP